MSRLSRDALEAKVAQIWCEVLGLDEVARDENFFDAGGHSLNATQIAVRLEEELGFEVTVRMIFDAPTIAEFAARIVEVGARVR
jgi:acyl carrier protein